MIIKQVKVSRYGDRDPFQVMIDVELSSRMRCREGELEAAINNILVAGLTTLENGLIPAESSKPA